MIRMKIHQGLRGSLEKSRMRIGFTNLVSWRRDVAHEAENTVITLKISTFRLKDKKPLRLNEDSLTQTTCHYSNQRSPLKKFLPSKRHKQSRRHVLQYPQI